MNAIADSVPAEDREWLRDETARQLAGCRVPAAGGLNVFTPDGVGNYRALWTRDFAYMVEFAGDLLEPGEVRANILYLLAGQRDDGCIPDRVNTRGLPVYSPGPESDPLADHALDNGPFMALLAAAYVRRSGDLAFFREVEPAVRRGLDFVRRGSDGLVWNSPRDPQCPYGFTDNVCKTGRLLFCSVLYFDACRRMAELCREAGCGDPAEYSMRAERIREGLGVLWDESTGMFLAADGDCRQIDVWGSAYAVHAGCTGPDQADRVAAYLCENYDGIVQCGQVRHLPADEYWQRFFRPQGVPPGTYQNGAFWATPLAWIVPTVARRRPDLAERMLRDVIADFRSRGVHECVNGPVVRVPNYVASAVSVYAAVFGHVGR